VAERYAKGSHESVRRVGLEAGSSICVNVRKNDVQEEISYNEGKAD
jgi:hypothetical protein